MAKRYIKHWLLEITASPTKNGFSSSYILNTYYQAEKAACPVDQDEAPKVQLNIIQELATEGGRDAFLIFFIL